MSTVSNINSQCINLYSGRIGPSNQIGDQYLKSRMQLYLSSEGKNYEFEVDSNGMLLMPWKSIHIDQTTTIMIVGVFRTVLNPTTLSFAVLGKKYNETIPELYFSDWSQTPIKVGDLLDAQLTAWKIMIKQKILSDFRFGADIQMAILANQMLLDYRHNNELQNKRPYIATSAGAGDTNEQHFKKIREGIETNITNRKRRTTGGTGTESEVCIESLIQSVGELNAALESISDKDPTKKMSQTEFLSNVIPEDETGDKLIDKMMCMEETTKDHDTYVNKLTNITRILIQKNYTYWSGMLGAILERVSNRIKKLEPGNPKKAKHQNRVNRHDGNRSRR